MNKTTRFISFLALFTSVALALTSLYIFSGFSQGGMKPAVTFIILTMSILVATMTSDLSSDKKLALKITIGMSVAWLISTLISRIWPDANHDSVTSHIVVVKALEAGWNPWRDYSDQSMFNSVDNILLFPPGKLDPLRVNTGVGFQVLQALTNTSFYVQQSYSFWHVIFAALAFLSVKSFIQHLRMSSQSNSKRFELVIPFVIVFGNQVVLTQVFSNYADAVIHNLAISIVCLTAIVLFGKKANPWPPTAILFVIYATGISIKLSFLTFFMYMLPVIIFLFCSMRKDRGVWFQSFAGNLRDFIWQTIAFLTLVVTLIFPVLNTIAHSLQTSNSFFDFLAYKKTWSGVTFAESIMPKQSLLSYILSPTHINPSDVLYNGLWAKPTKSEVFFAGEPDVRIGGAGPLFGEMLIILIVVLSCTTIVRLRRGGLLYLKEKTKILYIYTFYCTVCTVLILWVSPFSFNFRHYPQIYILFVLLFLLLLDVSKTLFSLTVVSLIFVTNSVIIAKSSYNHRENIKEWVTEMRYVKSTHQKGGYLLDNRYGLLLLLEGEYSSFTRSSIVDEEDCSSTQIIWGNRELGVCVPK